MYYPVQTVNEKINFGRNTITQSRGLKELHDSEGNTYGGYGWQTEEIPITQALTRQMKKEWSLAKRMLRKGDLAELHARYGTTNIDVIGSIIVTKSVGVLRTERFYRPKK